MKETLNRGEWIYRPIDQHWSQKTAVFTGSWEHRRKVRDISRHQAMSLSRWFGDPLVYYNVQDRNRKRIDIRVAGDLEAFFGRLEQIEDVILDFLRTHPARTIEEMQTSLPLLKDEEVEAAVEDLVTAQKVVRVGVDDPQANAGYRFSLPVSPAKKL